MAIQYASREEYAGGKSSLVAANGLRPDAYKQQKKAGDELVGSLDGYLNDPAALGNPEDVVTVRKELPNGEYVYERVPVDTILKTMIVAGQRALGRPQEADYQHVDLSEI